MTKAQEVYETLVDFRFRLDGTPCPFFAKWAAVTEAMKEAGLLGDDDE